MRIHLADNLCKKMGHLAMAHLESAIWEINILVAFF